MPGTVRLFHARVGDARFAPALIPGCYPCVPLARRSERRSQSRGEDRATRSDGCAVLIAGFTFEQWPSVRRGLTMRRTGLFVYEQLGLTPPSVSTDGTAHVALRDTALLAEFVPAGTVFAIAPSVPHRHHAVPSVSRRHTVCGRRVRALF
jgi:hypothetical protein